MPLSRACAPHSSFTGDSRNVRTSRGSGRSRKTLKSVTDRALICEFFAMRKPHYVLADVLRLTRSAEQEIARAVNEETIRPEAGGVALRFNWEDVATLAFQRWRPRMVAAALDVGYRNAMPTLNRVKHIDIHLPLYQIRLLHVLAEMRRGGFRVQLNASDILEQQLLDLASSLDASVMEEAIPGFGAAIRYPYFIPRDDDWATAFCRFCGRVSGVAGREMCDDCIARHEPRMHLGEHGLPELDQEDE
jgi:hypothetical protein